MVLLTSKGYASRAVKDLLDAIGENSGEEITFFRIHDADAYGTTIYDALQYETGARPDRKKGVASYINPKSISGKTLWKRYPMI